MNSSFDRCVCGADVVRDECIRVYRALFAVNDLRNPQ
jgi:hypothetical protein